MKIEFNKKVKNKWIWVKIIKALGKAKRGRGDREREREMLRYGGNGGYGDVVLGCCPSR